MEQWKPVKDLSLYEVSSLGRIMRMPGVQCRRPRMVHGYVNPINGYEQVVLCQEAKKYSRYTHRLVAEAFIGIPPRMTVNHKNGNKTDNRLENLEVVTLSENVKHRYRVLGMQPARGCMVRDSVTGRFLHSKAAT